MIKILGSHSYVTDLSMMMLPAGQTMGLPPLRNVLVPGQRCVAYLTPKNHWLLSCNLVTVFCICVYALCMYLYLSFVSAMYCAAYLTQQTYWPLSSPGETLSFGSHDDRLTKDFKVTISYPAAEMFQVVGPSLSASVLS